MQDVPEKPSSSEEDGHAHRSYRLRPASSSDAGFIADLDRRRRGRYLLAASRDERMWRYEITGRDPEGDESLQVRIVEDEVGHAVGYVCHTRDAQKGTLQVFAYELVDGVSWLEVTPDALRGLAKIVRELIPNGDELASLTFGLGEHHPLYETVPEPPLYELDRRDHYSYYVRVPDLPGFIRHLAPVLEQRLAASVAAGHTGKLEVSFYGGGLRLVLERGLLGGVETWSPTYEEDGAAAFPDLTFLQLLFGYRSLRELDRAFADCSPGDGDAQVLLGALFPRRPSDLQPIY